MTIGLPRRWCPSCEWNLDAEPPTVFGLDRVDRRLHRVATRLTDAQFVALSEGPLVRQSMTAARLTTLTAAVVLLAGVTAIAVAGVWLILYDFFSPATVLGILLAGMAILLRPRLGRLSGLIRAQEAVELDGVAVPELVSLIEQIAAATGAPVPRILLLGKDLNAFTATVGLRRRRVLYLGLPLWATLEPQERVALLGHELGHFVNGDVRRGLLTQMAETTLGRIAALFDGAGASRGGFAEIVTRVLGFLVARLAMALQLLLVWTSQRDSQRAEYLADDLGARAGGTTAAVGLLDHLLIAPSIDTVVRREARAGNGPPAWYAAARTARTNLAPNVPVLRRLSRRTEASLFASHPPQGLRAAMLEQRPASGAAVVLTESRSARIDAELAPHQEQIRRELTY